MAALQAPNIAPQVPAGKAARWRTITRARDESGTVAADPRLLDPGHAMLREAILNRFADSITLADVG